MRKTSILVLANRTALSASLEAALRARMERGAAEFTLVVPLGASAQARERAHAIAERLCEAGLEVTGIAGNTDPLTAVLEAWGPGDFDEIVVSTLPAWRSRWMETSLPQRIERHTGALVRHFEAQDSPAAATSAPRRVASGRP